MRGDNHLKGFGMVEGKNPADTHSSPLASFSPTERRQFLANSLAATAVGSVVALFPLGAGSLILIDPLRKKTSGGAERPYVRVASLDMLPADGTPVQVPVLADLSDAWNRESNQPIGAVYLMRAGEEVKCFNAICPHAGCFVGYNTAGKNFACPCHTSSFNLDGSIIAPSPSPRAMDELKVDQEHLQQTGEIKVQFVNYLSGKHEQVAK
ncbi:MAG: ubiquinol-cytochrome c reductase iron-sulfur subunit [Planctomycetota bacterium]